MSYQSICKGLYKKASSEQLKKLASLIGMRKRAKTPVQRIPKSYLDERDAAADYLAKNYISPTMAPSIYLSQLAPGADYGKNFYTIPVPVSKIEERRANQVNDIMRDLMYGKYKVIPGSNDWNMLRKYYLQRGGTNLFNKLNPLNPRKVESAPTLQKEYKGLTPEVIDATGNIVGNTRKPGAHKDIG